jgi:hypothetical protein
MVSGGTLINIWDSKERISKNILVSDLVRLPNYYYSYCYDIDKGVSITDKIREVWRNRDFATVFRLRFCWKNTVKGSCINQMIYATGEQRFMLTDGMYQKIITLIPGEHLMPQRFRFRVICEVTGVELAGVSDIYGVETECGNFAADGLILESTR